MKHSCFILLLNVLLISSCKKKDDEYRIIKYQLEKVLVDDQKYRAPVYNPQKQNPIDRNNLMIVTKIIDSLGWLGKDKIGNDANLALFVTIQHAGKLSVMEKYLPIMKEAVKRGNAERSQMAYLIDRVEILNNRKQIYGTQYSIDDKGKVFFKDIADSSHVNTRRKSMNLGTIDEYIKMIDSDR